MGSSHQTDNSRWATPPHLVPEKGRPVDDKDPRSERALVVVVGGGGGETCPPLSRPAHGWRRFDWPHLEGRDARSAEMEGEISPRGKGVGARGERLSGRCAEIWPRCGRGRGRGGRPHLEGGDAAHERAHGRVELAKVAVVVLA